MNEAQELISLLRQYLSKDLSHLLAEFLWQYYNDLRAVGFTEEQALNLCKFPEIKK